MIEIDEQEEILMTVRKHWFILLLDIFYLICLITVPILILVGLYFVPVERMIAFSSEPFYAGGFFLFVWLMIVWMVGWQFWTNYYLDVLIITNKRIFDIEQQGFFRRKSGAFRIDRIQNVSVEVKGIIQTLLDFGTMRLETAGEKDDFIAPYIGRPYEVKKFISELQDKSAETEHGHSVGHITRVNESAGEKLIRTDSEGL